jgi:sec-independent protein translocase protein TatC
VTHEIREVESSVGEVVDPLERVRAMATEATSDLSVAEPETVFPGNGVPAESATEVVAGIDGAAIPAQEPVPGNCRGARSLMAEEQETFLSHLVELRDRLIRDPDRGRHRIRAAGLLRPRALFVARRALAGNPAGGRPDDRHRRGRRIPGADEGRADGRLPGRCCPTCCIRSGLSSRPGLYAHEKKLAIPLLVASVLLFFIGMAFAYFAFFPMVFGFMAKFAPEGVAWMTDIEKYFSFVLTMFLAFGVTFEVPVIVIVLVKVGIVDVVKLREWRPYVIVGAFVVGAVFTPPDVISQFMMAVPLWLLYELG